MKEAIKEAIEIYEEKSSFLNNDKDYEEVKKAVLNIYIILFPNLEKLPEDLNKEQITYFFENIEVILFLSNIIKKPLFFSNNLMALTQAFKIDEQNKLTKLNNILKVHNIESLKLITSTHLILDFYYKNNLLGNYSILDPVTCTSPDIDKIIPLMLTIINTQHLSLKNKQIFISVIPEILSWFDATKCYENTKSFIGNVINNNPDFFVENFTQIQSLINTGILNSTDEILKICKKQTKITNLWTDLLNEDHKNLKGLLKNDIFTAFDNTFSYITNIIYKLDKDDTIENKSKEELKNLYYWNSTLVNFYNNSEIILQNYKEFQLRLKEANLPLKDFFTIWAKCFNCSNKLLEIVVDANLPAIRKYILGDIKNGVKDDKIFVDTIYYGTHELYKIERIYKSLDKNYQFFIPFMCKLNKNILNYFLTEINEAGEIPKLDILKTNETLYGYDPKIILDTNDIEIIKEFCVDDKKIDFISREKKYIQLSNKFVVSSLKGENYNEFALYAGISIEVAEFLREQSAEDVCDNKKMPGIPRQKLLKIFRRSQEYEFNILKILQTNNIKTIENILFGSPCVSKTLYNNILNGGLAIS